MKKTSAIIVFSLIIALTMPIFAVDISEITKKPEVPEKVVTSLDGIWNHVFVILASIGVGIAVIMLIVVAIKYMTTAPSERAEIKKYIVIYVVGAIFIFSCVGIVGLLKSVAEQFL